MEKLYSASPPYNALRLTKIVGKPSTWSPCRVIGIDASGDAPPQYIVEIRAADGTFYIDKIDLIRKQLT